ncbi:MAG TPA: xanthine dehydrogenase family protein molybdopterin-binding subunit [Stellaceae bacterium]|nr:xanthine dehydrogenase family protein molybdopterin-binding subunit [Stellaceae bacterium]
MTAVSGFHNAKVLGRDVPRVEDPALIRGQGRFADDIMLPGMLHAAFLRSPNAHARILSIDATAARALPGVHAVLTMADLAPHLADTRLRVAMPSPSYRLDLHRPVLADEEVVHVGEPIAVILADSRYIAEDAMAMIEVDYDPLPVANDCVAALEPGAPTAHDGAPSNLVAEMVMGYGDVDAAFEAAPHRFHERLTVHRGGSHSMECRGVVAVHDAVDDRLTVWCSTQMPHAAQRLLCDIMGLAEQQLRVATPDVGGGFGPKLVFYPEEVVVAAAARLLGRPVKWIEDRREHFVATTQERDQIWDVELATDDEGRILGVRGQLIHDHGAWTARGVNVPQGAMSAMPLPYLVPAYRIDLKVAATNKVPVTPVRGAGQPQGVFAMERLLDAAASGLGIDRAEIRRRNQVPPERMPYETPMVTRGGIAITLDSGDYPKCMAMALDAAGWEGFAARQMEARASGRHIGIGLANYVEGTGRGPYEHVSIRLEPSGRIFVRTGAAAMGQGTRTMLSQIVAEQLGGDMSNIEVIAGDTHAAPLGIGGSNSRQTVMAGNSAHAAALKIRERVLEVAAQIMQTAPADLEIEGRMVRAQTPRNVQMSNVQMSNVQMSLGEIARVAYGQAGFKLPGKGGPGIAASEEVVIDAMTYSNGTAVAEVEVDVETGEVAIRNLVFAHDCGHVLHPRIVEGQLMGGIAHGIGNALYEFMGFDENAQPLTTNLAEYLLVTATEMPPVTLLHMESPTPLNRLGIKGVGESGVIPIGGAIASAIDHALEPFGVRVAKLPLSPVDVLALINEGRARSEGKR